MVYDGRVERPGRGQRHRGIAAGEHAVAGQVETLTTGRRAGQATDVDGQRALPRIACRRVTFASVMVSPGQFDLVLSDTGPTAHRRGRVPRRRHGRGGRYRLVPALIPVKVAVVAVPGPLRLHDIGRRPAAGS